MPGRLTQEEYSLLHEAVSLEALNQEYSLYVSRETREEFAAACTNSHDGDAMRVYQRALIAALGKWREARTS